MKCHKTKLPITANRNRLRGGFHLNGAPGLRGRCHPSINRREDIKQIVLLIRDIHFSGVGIVIHRAKFPIRQQRWRYLLGVDIHRKSFPLPCCEVDSGVGGNTEIFWASRDGNGGELPARVFVEDCQRCFISYPQLVTLVWIHKSHCQSIHWTLCLEDTL